MKHEVLNRILLFLILINSLPIYIYWGNDHIQKVLVGVFSILLVLLNQDKVLIKKNEIPLCLLTSFYIVYSSFSGVEGEATVINFAYCSLLFFLLNNHLRLLAFDVLKKTFAIILSLSLISYICIVLHWIQPIGEITHNIRSTTYIIYPFYVLETLSYFHPLYQWGLFRFNSIFDEPGYVGTLCALFLLVDFNLKGWNKIFLIAGFLSFSFAFWCLFLLTCLIKFRLRKEYITIILFCSIIVYKFWDVLFPTVFSRAIIEDGEMRGDNRVGASFEKAFNVFWNSNYIWLGMGNKAHQNYPGSSTFLSIIYNYGIAGFIMYISIFASIALRKFNWENSLFFCVYMINIYQRPYSISLISFLMLYIGIYKLNHNEKNIPNCSCSVI